MKLLLLLLLLLFLLFLLLFDQTRERRRDPRPDNSMPLFQTAHLLTFGGLGPANRRDGVLSQFVKIARYSCRTTLKSEL